MGLVCRGSITAIPVVLDTIFLRSNPITHVYPTIQSKQTLQLLFSTRDPRPYVLSIIRSSVYLPHSSTTARFDNRRNKVQPSVDMHPSMQSSVVRRPSISHRRTKVIQVAPHNHE